MFLWSGRQVAFVLVMVTVCGLALVYPAWRHWYDLIFLPLLLVVMALALRHAKRK